MTGSGCPGYVRLRCPRWLCWATPTAATGLPGLQPLPSLAGSHLSPGKRQYERRAVGRRRRREREGGGERKRERERERERQTDRQTDRESYTPETTLPGACRYRVSAETGWYGVCILWALSNQQNKFHTMTG